MNSTQLSQCFWIQVLPQTVGVDVKGLPLSDLGNSSAGSILSPSFLMVWGRFREIKLLEAFPKCLLYGENTALEELKLWLLLLLLLCLMDIGPGALSLPWRLLQPSARWALLDHPSAGHEPVPQGLAGISMFFLGSVPKTAQTQQLRALSALEIAHENKQPHLYCSPGRDYLRKGCLAPLRWSYGCQEAAEAQEQPRWLILLPLQGWKITGERKEPVK